MNGLHGCSCLSWLRALFAVACILPVSVASAEVDNCVPIGKVLLPDSRQIVSNKELVRQVKSRQVVLLGEHHDNAEHHRWQLEMITALNVWNDNLALGFEMFPRRMQSVLDQWVAGELSEKEFLEKVEWDKYWRFDSALYMPLFHYARMNRIPMYALNVERSFIREVGEKGWANVGADKKEGISTPAPASEGYLLMLASVFSQHGSQHSGSEEANEEALRKIMEQPTFKRFVESQQVWDRAMAQKIAQVVKEDKPDMFIAVMGSGHMMNRYGVPHQLKDLDIASTAVLVPWDPEFECDLISEGFADAVIGLAPDKLSDQAEETRKPRLGIYLEPADEGVRIIRVVDGSLAERSGIKKGDVVVAMAGRPISEVQQIIDIVKAMQWGTWLPITVVRDGEELEVIAKFPPLSEQG